MSSVQEENEEQGERMKCPECKTVLLCGCASCHNKDTKKKKVEKWVHDINGNWYIMCPECFFVKRGEWWEDYEWEKDRLYRVIDEAVSEKKMNKKVAKYLKKIVKEWNYDYKELDK